MTGIKIVNLNILIEEIGEDGTRDFLSYFSCPLNADVEDFIKRKSVEFALQGFSQTHLVMVPYKGDPVMAGYFTLANKYITVSTKYLSSTLKKRLNKFSIFDDVIKAYPISAPLIAQLGKNYTNGYNKLISGNELLEIACNKVKRIQLDLGGRFVYVECEFKPKLIEFYRGNGFYEFDTRKLDRDEANLEGDYLVQLLKYIKR